MRDQYEDIIHLSRPESKKHPPMPPEDRAAQFAPFAALTGHGAAIRESARLTQERQELAEDLQEELDEKLELLVCRLRQDRAAASVVWFEPDAKKAGGAYRTSGGRVSRIDTLHRTMTMEDGTRIPIDNIMDLEIDPEPEDLPS